MSYPARTLLRYWSPSTHAHDTALVLEVGGVLQVKRASEPVKIAFDSVEAWLDSLPEKPSLAQMEVVLPEENTSRGEEKKKEVEEEEEVEVEVEVEEEVEEEVEVEVEKKEEKKKKEKKEKSPTLYLIPRSKGIPSTNWTLHVYRIMKEANPALIRRPNVVEAFNALVQYLIDQSSHILSYNLSNPHRYILGVNIDTNPPNHPLRGMCAVRMNSMTLSSATRRLIFHGIYPSLDRIPELTPEGQAIQDRIVALYRALFHLIREDVVPYMEQKEKERRRKECERTVDRLVERMEVEKSRHDCEMKDMRERMRRKEENYEKRMEDLRKQIVACGKTEGDS